MSDKELSKKDTVYYNKLWQQKRMDPQRLYMQERVLVTLRNLFLKILDSGFSGRILDIGSGDNVFVEVCLKNNIDAVGIDICDGVDFEKDKLPYKNNEFDIVIIYSVIEHLHSPGNMLSEARRVLKYNGRLIVITTNFELESRLLCGCDFFNDPTHIHPYNRKSIRTLMKMFNFQEQFIGLWTVCKSHLIWKLPETMQFYYGAILPFRGDAKFIPAFLKGKSKSMLCVFKKVVLKE